MSVFISPQVLKRPLKSYFKEGKTTVIMKIMKRVVMMKVVVVKMMVGEVLVTWRLKLRLLLFTSDL